MLERTWVDNRKGYHLPSTICMYQFYLLMNKADAVVESHHFICVLLMSGTSREPSNLVNEGAEKNYTLYMRISRRDFVKGLGTSEYKIRLF